MNPKQLLKPAVTPTKAAVAASKAAVAAPKAADRHLWLSRRGPVWRRGTLVLVA